MKTKIKLGKILGSRWSERSPKAFHTETGRQLPGSIESIKLCAQLASKVAYQTSRGSSLSTQKPSNGLIYLKHVFVKIL